MKRTADLRLHAISSGLHAQGPDGPCALVARNVDDNLVIKHKVAAAVARLRDRAEAEDVDEGRPAGVARAEVPRGRAADHREAEELRGRRLDGRVDTGVVVRNVLQRLEVAY